MIMIMKRRVSALGLILFASSAMAAPASTNATQIQKLERLLDARNQVQIQMQTQLNEMGDELNELRGQIEKNTYQIQQVLNRQRELYADVDKLTERLDNTKKAPVTTLDPQQETTPAITYSANTDENAAYDHALALVRKERNYNEAIRELNAFLVKYPDSTYKPNAHYWLGQLYFSIKKDVPNAQKNFQAVVQNKDSNKRADSLLKLGLLSEQMKDKVKAKQYYQDVLRDYPKSSSAERAQKQLAAF